MAGGARHGPCWWRLRDPHPGPLSDALLTAFEGVTTTVQPVATVLYGPVQDQAALYRLLQRIQSLGRELVEIRQLPAAADEVALEPEHQPPDP